MQHEDDYLSKCVEGMTLAFFNQGEVCTCPSRALIQESIYDDFIGLVVERSSASSAATRWTRRRRWARRPPPSSSTAS
jgi:acyl-CoA reductase-like NAD-dependent aldehyde dehydrogenase